MAVKNPKTVPAPRLKRVNPEASEQSRARVREAIAGNKNNVSVSVFRVSRFFSLFLFFLFTEKDFYLFQRPRLYEVYYEYLPIHIAFGWVVLSFAELFNDEVVTRLEKSEILIAGWKKWFNTTIHLKGFLLYVFFSNFINYIFSVKFWHLKKI